VVSLGQSAAAQGHRRAIAIGPPGAAAFFLEWTRETFGIIPDRACAVTTGMTRITWAVLIRAVA
jgi:hypothetical protein